MAAVRKGGCGSIHVGLPGKVVFHWRFLGYWENTPALLEVDTLKASKNQTEDIKAALENLKKENGYLFEGDSQVPPPFNPGTGVNPPAPKGDFNFGFTGIRAHGTEK